MLWCNAARVFKTHVVSWPSTKHSTLTWPQTINSVKRLIDLFQWHAQLQMCVLAIELLHVCIEVRTRPGTFTCGFAKLWSMSAYILCVFDLWGTSVVAIISFLWCIHTTSKSEAWLKRKRTPDKRHALRINFQTHTSKRSKLPMICAVVWSTTFGGEKTKEWQFFAHAKNSISKTKTHTKANPKDHTQFVLCAGSWRSGVGLCAATRNFLHQNHQKTTPYNWDLVDSASSHMLVSRTKPCMPKNNCISRNLRMAHYIRRNLPQKSCGQTHYRITWRNAKLIRE